MATSGPGATNLVTGIANAFMDSVPMVVITGQVPSALQGTDAFQEVDIFGITLPIVKHSYIVRSVTDIPHIVNEAFQLAQSGRPGPVLIDLPKDISAGMGDVVYTPPHAWPELISRMTKPCRRQLKCCQRPGVRWLLPEAGSPFQIR